MANYYQPEIETMPYEQLKQLQNERLVKQVQHVWDNVPYYRAKMEEKGVTPADIQSVDDLHKLPFLTKADLRDYLACDAAVPPARRRGLCPTRRGFARSTCMQAEA